MHYIVLLSIAWWAGKALGLQELRTGGWELIDIFHLHMISGGYFIFLSEEVYFPPD